jgi:hypothetical protein
MFLFHSHIHKKNRVLFKHVFDLKNLFFAQKIF